MQWYMWRTQSIDWNWKKTLRKTSVLAYLNCDLLKNKGVCILHYIRNPEDRKCLHFLNYPKFFLKKLLFKAKTSFTNFSKTELFSEFQNIPQKRFVSVSFDKVTNYCILCNYCASESYWEHCQLFKMRLLAKLVYS